jgi:nitrite reductase/ring-hydroxylating ferredoxin subunit
MPAITTVDALEEGIPTVFRAQGREFVLVRWRDRVFALRNVCPHQAQSFEHGFVRDHVAAGATVGDVAVTGDGVLVCPWHCFEYWLENGRCVADDNLRLRTYDVEIRDGHVTVEM